MVIRLPASNYRVHFWSNHGHNLILNFCLGNYTFPEIDQACKREQRIVVESIKRDSRDLYLGIDDQCDSPGHSATVTAMYRNCHGYANK